MLTATGALHILVAGAIAGNTYLAMARDGLLASAEKDLERSFALWFLVCGILLILWGMTLQHYMRKEQQPAPALIGWALLLFSLIGGLIEPVSGFWLFLPQGAIILLANRRRGDINSRGI